MLDRIAAVPVIVLIVGLSGFSMLVPAIYGLLTDDGLVARAFGYSALLTFVLFVMLALATWNHRARHEVRGQILTLLAFYGLIPVLLAWPMSIAMDEQINYLWAIFDMISALTTTGAPVVELNATPSVIHLWRAEVAWLGGFFFWVMAIAVLAPLNLGGFEVTSLGRPGQSSENFFQIDEAAGLTERIGRFALQLLPVYLGLTAILWLALMLAGDPPLVASIHAMSALSTSGLSPLGGPGSANSGVTGEVLVFVFLFLAVSRLTFSRDIRGSRFAALRQDPEMQIGLLIVTCLPLLLFLRHWIASFDSGEGVTFVEGLAGIWGALFTAVSFLTTTGWESRSWDAALSWSGLRSPGLLLMGLAMFGGGVATTAGGVKLLRIYALYKHGLREMEKLIQPSSISGAGRVARRIRREGAYLAWIAFMLFAFSIALVWVGLAMSGVGFEDALVLTIAALTNCGPLIGAAMVLPIALDELTTTAKTILAVAMILGRIEALAIIALLNPEFWRR